MRVPARAYQFALRRRNRRRSDQRRRWLFRGRRPRDGALRQSSGGRPAVLHAMSGVQIGRGCARRRTIGGATRSVGCGPVEDGVAPRSYFSRPNGLGSGVRTNVGRTPTHIGSDRHADGSAPLENPLAATLTNAKAPTRSACPSRSANYVVEVRRKDTRRPPAPPFLGGTLNDRLRTHPPLVPSRLLENVPRLPASEIEIEVPAEPGEPINRNRKVTVLTRGHSHGDLVFPTEHNVTGRSYSSASRPRSSTR